MYTEFFGLKEKPFGKTPDPRFLYLSSGHREALARLQYVLEEREMALLTGEIGCGKTTLSRALMDAMGEGYRFCFVFNPRLTAREFLQTVANDFVAGPLPEGKDQLLAAIHRSLYALHSQGITPVIVVDEAQLVPDREIFDEIRLLTNFQLDDRNLLSIVVMGQPELRTMLAAPVYEPFRQRISINYHLQPLDLVETQEYLDFRLEVAGGENGLFTPDAVLRIFQLSGGVPRRINQVATNALLEGYGCDATVIDAVIIDSMVEEIVI